MKSRLRAFAARWWPVERFDPHVEHVDARPLARSAAVSRRTLCHADRCALMLHRHRNERLNAALDEQTASERERATARRPGSADVIDMEV
jgi:hypothetical protein